MLGFPKRFEGNTTTPEELLHSVPPADQGNRISLPRLSDQVETARQAAGAKVESDDVITASWWTKLKISLGIYS